MKGDVAVVTGAGSGIGRATALLFAQHGASVVVADLNLNGAKETLNHLKEAGGKGIAIQIDVSSEKQVKKMIKAAIEEYGKITYACNNAGIEGEQALTHECSNKNWEKVIATNLTGTWLCMKHQIPEMVKSGGGAIVNISSIAGLLGFQGIPAYVSSKHAINGLTKTAALEYAAEGVRVNSVCPGAIETPMIDRFVGEGTDERKGLEAQHPMGRFGRPEEIAEAVVWLCSEKASFITGQTLAVDGGFTVR